MYVSVCRKGRFGCLPCCRLWVLPSSPYLYYLAFIAILKGSVYYYIFNVRNLRLRKLNNIIKIQPTNVLQSLDMFQQSRVSSLLNFHGQVSDLVVSKPQSHSVPISALGNLATLSSEIAVDVKYCSNVRREKTFRQGPLEKLILDFLVFLCFRDC